MYMYTNHNHIPAKKRKKKKVVPFQNGGQITDFYFASSRFWPKFEKIIFPKEFFNEFWLLARQHEYINIAKENNFKVYSVTKLALSKVPPKANNQCP